MVMLNNQRIQSLFDKFGNFKATQSAPGQGLSKSARKRRNQK